MLELRLGAKRIRTADLLRARERNPRNEEAFFVRPAVRAALELGAVEFMRRLDTNLNMGLEGFTQTFRLAIGDLDERDLPTLARAIRRLFFAGLIDMSMTPAEFEGELRALVRGMVGVRHQPAAPVPL